MPTTDPIVITPSTSVVLVNTADFSGNPIVLLPNIDSLGRVITIRDADGGSLAKPIYISTTGGAQFQQEISSVTISSVVITQPYGFYTITPRLIDPSGTRYGIMNAFAFRESSDYAYVNMLNTNMAYVSTLSTVNLEVHQDINVIGNINVAGSINYTNPGTVTFNADIINTRDVNASTIKSATIYTSTAYASSIYLANTLEASTLRLTSRPVFDLSGSSSWSNYMSGGTDPNSMTLGNPGAGAGAQIGTGTEFFGIRSFSKAGPTNFSTTVLARYGNVGINCPYTDITYNGGDPNYTLSVNGALRLSNSDTRIYQNNVVFKADGLAGSSNRYVNVFGGTESNYTLYSANNETHGFYTGTDQYQWITADKGATYPETIKFWTGNNVERMRIDATGNVGIGRTNPGQALDVSGSVSASAVSTIAVSTATVTAGLGLVGAPSYSFAGDANTGFYSPAAGQVGLVGGGVEGARVDASGIQLRNGSASKPALNFGLGSGSDANTGLYHPVDNTIGVVINGSEAVRVDSQSRVGIGRTNPGQALDVSGSVSASAVSTIAVSTATVTAGLGSAALPSYSFAGDANTGFYSPGPDQVGLIGGGVEGVRVDASGIQFRDGSATKPSINFGLGAGTDTDTGIYHPADGIIGFATNGNERMRINTTGQVGIGKTPSVALDVLGQIQTAASIVLPDGTAGVPALNFGNGTGADANTGIYHPADNTMAFSINGTERMRINASGQVGIGTTPSYALDVSGDLQVTGQSAGGIYVRNSVSDSRVWLYPKNGTNATEIKRYDGTNGNFDIINYGTGQINLTANSSSYNAISILNNGSVGVGTTTPSASYKLDVNGNTNVTGNLNVTGNITGSSSIMPAGSITAYGGSSAPTGWLLCNGQAVSRTTYATLFTAISSNYGNGDGVNTFNVPNIGDRFPIGKGSDVSSNTLGYTSGSKTHTLTIAEMPTHNHSASLELGYGNSGSFGTVGWGGGSIDGYSTGYPTIGNTGGGGAHNNMPPYIVVNYIIKT
jgi:microcystin-dependent protein